jgi:ElaB/YqjD/DUF883 family membrane-anchored ribosome-binding protein
MTLSRNALFIDRSFTEFRREQLKGMKDEISKLSSGELQKNSTDSLALIFAAEYTPSQIELQDPVKDDGKEVEKDVSHRQDLIIRDRSTPTYKKFQRLKIRLPFNVDKKLFRCKPGRFDLNPPLYDELNRNEVVYYIDYATKNRDPEEIKEEIENELEDWLDKVEKYVGNLNDDIKQMQEKFRGEAQSAIEGRRDEVETKQQVMEDLGVDTNRTENQGYVVPEKKRDIEVPTSQSEDSPEILQDQTFLDILEIIDDLGINIERSAKRLRDLDEESLRDIFLAGINSHYTGLATGESFNRGGKTDILLRYDNKNLFVSECKFWKGQSQYKDAIDQLLDNLTVRDTHASLLVFSRNRKYSQMEDRVEEATKDHDQFETQLPEFVDHDISRFQTSSGTPVKVAVKTFNLLD